MSELEVGDVLEKSVQGNNGVVMLEAGTVLTEKYINRLKTLRIKFVHLSDSPEFGTDSSSKSKRSASDSWIRPDIDQMKDNENGRKDAIKLVTEFVDRSLMLEQIVLPFPAGNFRQQFRDMLMEITSQPALADELSVMMQTDRILFEHALNVTLCSSVIGTAQNFDSSKLYELALGALFCDIGMTRLPLDLTKVNRELNESELTLLRQHTNEGYRVLKGIKEIPLVSAQCALLHHERYRGSGYPLGMTNDNIPEFAQIVGIADVYNALGSPRHHRNAYRPAEAIEYLLASGNYDFDWGLIKAFLNHVIIYPVSTLVKLSSGQTAAVMETESRPIQRPLVQVLSEPDGTVVKIPYSLELQRHTNVVIIGKADN
ncbi:HD-GYP domain-containing protein [Cohnella cholangitidis]|uniref:HD-GYP domain-containing protein n=1 Tax=Cohnella cholangitidis TaxID=2598458 RepID=UPI0015FE5E49|nr:HD domain-containing phosphohydrolase [Cohnella cholangitidis]